MINYKKYISVVILVFYATFSFGQKTNGYEPKLFVSQLDTLQYRILLPKNFDVSKQYPLVLFLHGAGERGKDNTAQLIHGSKLFSSKANRKKFPAIVIFPQCSADSYWANVKIDRTTKPLSITFPKGTEPTKPMELVMKLMDEMILKPYVNKKQIYVGGMSMGGMGTFEIIFRKPEMFAAAITICGAGNPENTAFYAKTTPLWLFHGAMDDVVNPQASVKIVSSILENGGKPNFTLYAKDNHNSWDSAFAEPNLLPWLFSNIKK